MTSRHELKVIMFTNIVGYTAMKGKDEQHTLSLVAKNKDQHKK